MPNVLCTDTDGESTTFKRELLRSGRKEEARALSFEHEYVAVEIFDSQLYSLFATRRYYNVREVNGKADAPRTARIFRERGESVESNSALDPIVSERRVRRMALFFLLR